MQADSGRKYRLYPTADQVEVLTRWGHTCRALWNVALEQREFMSAQRPPGRGRRRVTAAAPTRRDDFTHKLTTDLAKNHGWVGIENLNVKGMTASAKGSAQKPGTGVAQKAGLNRAILDNAPYGIEIEVRARRAAGPNSTRRHAVPSPRATGRRLREPMAGAA